MPLPAPGAPARRARPALHLAAALALGVLPVDAQTIRPLAVGGPGGGPATLSTFTFYGLCDAAGSACTPGERRATLVLQNFTGGQFSTDNFYSFTYGNPGDSYNFSYNVTDASFPRGFFDAGGSIESTPGQYDVSLGDSFDGYRFNSTRDTRQWSVMRISDVEDVSGFAPDSGSFHVWNGDVEAAVVPEPGAVVLLAAGLAGAGVVLRIARRGRPAR